MKIGSWVTGLIDISEDDDLTAEIDLGDVYDTVIIRIPTLTSSSISLQVAEASGGTFNDLYMTIPTTGKPIQIKTDKATTAHIVQMPLGGFQYIKIAASDAQGDDRTFNLCGVRG
jgi:hypothetical protein